MSFLFNVDLCEQDICCPFLFFFGIFIIWLLSLWRHNIFLKGLLKIADESREAKEYWEVFWVNHFIMSACEYCCVLGQGEILNAEAKNQDARENGCPHTWTPRSDYVPAPGDGQNLRRKNSAERQMKMCLCLPVWVLDFSRDQWLKENPSYLM